MITNLHLTRSSFLYLYKTSGENRDKWGGGRKEAKKKVEEDTKCKGVVFNK
jgi:hypothetical protein